MGSTPLSPDVAEVIRSLPSRVSKLEQTLEAAGKKVVGDVASADLPAQIASLEQKLQNVIAWVDNLDLPTRVQTIENQLAQLKELGGAELKQAPVAATPTLSSVTSPKPPANPNAGIQQNKGTAAQRTPPPGKPGPAK